MPIRIPGTRIWLERSITWEGARDDRIAFHGATFVLHASERPCAFAMHLVKRRVRWLNTAPPAAPSKQVTSPAGLVTHAANDTIAVLVSDRAVLEPQLLRLSVACRPPPTSLVVIAECRLPFIKELGLYNGLAYGCEESVQDIRETALASATAAARAAHKSIAAYVRATYAVCESARSLRSMLIRSGCTELIILADQNAPARIRLRILLYRSGVKSSWA